jgi:hypothetical protein
MRILGRGDMTEDHTTKNEKKRWEDFEGWDRTFAQMWEMCFEPELEKRKSSGAISSEFSLFMAQALYPPEGPNRILFNEEVKGDGLLRAPRAVNKGDPVTFQDLAHLEKYELPDELLDCGHFTIIRCDEGWKMFFNFLSGRSKAKDMLELAQEFLQAAEKSAGENHAGPAVDNLFSASELISKAELILHRSRAVTSKRHGAIKSSINAWAKLGNIDSAFIKLFNKLGNQRPNARYGDKDNRPPIPSSDDFELVKAMVERGLDRVAKATDRKLDHDDDET